jgi:galactokinase
VTPWAGSFAPANLLDGLVEIARGLPGCIGARLTGAGFGGCTVNLVESERVEEFRSGLERAYLERVGKETRLYVCKASEGGRGKGV